MRFLSLFAGVGGIDLGLERAGMRCVGQVEIDDFCRAVLAKHWPDVPRFGDITEVGADELASLGPIDLVAGGFPCQPVSSAGRQLAQADERWLWPEFARIVRLARPRWVLAENVPSLRSVNHGTAFGEVVDDLAALGYDAEWTCFSAAEVGAPHLRDRVWIVAYADGRSEPQEQQGDGCLRRGWAEQSSGLGAGGGDRGWDRAARTLADSNGGGQPQLEQRDGEPGGEWQPSLGRDAERCALGDTDSAGLQGLGRPERNIGERTSAAAGTARRAVAHADGSRRGQRRDVQPGAPAGARPDGAARRPSARCEPGTAQPRMGRQPDGLPIGVDGHQWPAFRGQAQHPWEPPRTGHRIPQRAKRVKALGNAVVPQCAEWVGRCILTADGTSAA